MKHLKFIPLLLMLFASVKNEASAQLAKTLYESRVEVMSHQTSETSLRLVLSQGTSSFTPGNLVVVSYQPLGDLSPQKMYLFLCSKTETELTLISISPGNRISIRSHDKVHFAELSSVNLHYDQVKNLFDFCRQVSL
ncbi:MAG: hypothetical protein QG654_403 [Patescibacteria group bacterium]|nr:hypothetical protein [Patescibacteria group bacterium]